VAADQHLGLVRDARLFALLNIASADALISCWDAKYTYNLWRPVTAIRAAETDGNPDTEADAGWTPLLVTPNFPSYTSAHSTVSAAAAGVLTSLFGPDHHFTVAAEGLPGVTRSFDSFGAAAQEAGQSRIYGGIHYQFDNVAGQQLGHSVADYVMGGFLQPRDDDGDDQLRAAAAAPAPVNAALRALQRSPPLEEEARRAGDCEDHDAPVADFRQPRGLTAPPRAPGIGRPRPRGSRPAGPSLGRGPPARRDRPPGCSLPRRSVYGAAPGQARPGAATRLSRRPDRRAGPEAAPAAPPRRPRRGSQSP
jgi:hypothetical protein